jgi:hypothetical protein
MDKILNRVQNSSLITLDINKFYVTGDREELDIKFFLEDGILREKTFRKLISNYEWSNYRYNYTIMGIYVIVIIPL